MVPYFINIIDELEQQRTDILNRVKKLPADKFSYAPQGKWSISQILTHILVAEQLSLRYMKKKALGIDQLENAGLMASLRIQLLVVSQRIPVIKYKAPKVVVVHTPPAFPLQELMMHWETHRTELKKFLDEIPEKNKRKLVYKHVVGGRLDARQALIFFREHINHHLPQIKRLLD